MYTKFKNWPQQIPLSIVQANLGSHTFLHRSWRNFGLGSQYTVLKTRYLDSDNPEDRTPVSVIFCKGKSKSGKWGRVCQGFVVNQKGYVQFDKMVAIKQVLEGDEEGIKREVKHTVRNFGCKKVSEVTKMRKHFLSWRLSPEYYFVQPFVPGKNHDLLQLDMREKLTLISEMTKEMEHIHHKGITHQDIHEGNFNCEIIPGKKQEGQKKEIRVGFYDFGLAESTDEPNELREDEESIEEQEKSDDPRIFIRTGSELFSSNESRGSRNIKFDMFRMSPVIWDILGTTEERSSISGATVERMNDILQEDVEGINISDLAKYFLRKMGQYSACSNLSAQFWNELQQIYDYTTEIDRLDTEQMLGEVRYSCCYEPRLKLKVDYQNADGKSCYTEYIDLKETNGDDQQFQKDLLVAVEQASPACIEASSEAGEDSQDIDDQQPPRRYENQNAVHEVMLRHKRLHPILWQRGKNKDQLNAYRTQLVEARAVHLARCVLLTMVGVTFDDYMMYDFRSNDLETANLIISDYKKGYDGRDGEWKAQYKPKQKRVVEEYRFASNGQNKSSFFRLEKGDRKVEVDDKLDELEEENNDVQKSCVGSGSPSGT